MICTTGNALKQLETILCEFWRICATRNALVQLQDESVWIEMLLCSWKQFYASFDGSVQQEKL